MWAVSLARAQAKFPWLDVRLRAPARIVARADALNKWAGRPRAQMGLHPPPAAQMLPHPLLAPRIQEGAQHPVRLGLSLAQQREGLVVPGQVRVRADETVVGLLRAEHRFGEAGGADPAAAHLARGAADPAVHPAAGAGRREEGVVAFRRPRLTPPRSRSSPVSARGCSR